VNSIPETVSTDYDTSDKLYFEPLTLENVLNICDREKPDGIIPQLGGQTPLNLAAGLVEAGQTILGTSHRSIELAEDRKLFQALAQDLRLRQPASGVATTFDEAARVAERIGYPVLLRPSFVLSGEAMRVVWNREELEAYMARAIAASGRRPVLVDEFLEEATEVDVDAISDGRTTVIGGIMEHIEEAGIHSGDSSCALPPFSLNRVVQEEIRRITFTLAEGLGRIPKGTHDWDRFIAPETLEAHLAAAGLVVTDRRGMTWSPMRGFVLSNDLSINYLVAALFIKST